MNLDGKLNNVFFEFAIHNLKKSELNFDNKWDEDHVFIYFHQSFIVSYLDENFFKEKNCKFILITSLQMRPLALFYFQRFSNIYAIIDATDSLCNIISRIHETSQTNTRKVFCEINSKALTWCEFRILSMRLTGNRTSYIATSLNMPIKKVYWHDKVLTKKIGVRKLYELILAR
ncbi:hypothetical protein XK86_20135 [Hafnia alvei]|nr:hypothetical protein XK86_20135 [Hafnia alvei]